MEIPQIGVNAAGAPVEADLYNPWGRRQSGTGAQTGAIGFAGGVTDAGGDLQYLQARYYDPRTAQFLTRDPSEAGTNQPYLYANGNPTMYTDPSGECGVKDFAGGLLHGASFGLYKPKWADSCSYCYFAGTAAGGGVDPVGKAIAGAQLIRGGLRAAEGVEDAAKAAPTVVFSRSCAPGISHTFDDAVSKGAPTRLTRVDAAARDANRRAALRGQKPAPAGQSLDEYPFAFSAQGGCGSLVRAVPRAEQNYQGGVLSRFFQDHGVQPGDPFNVEFGP